jgi:hypothetical protein
MKTSNVVIIVAIVIVVIVIGAVAIYYFIQNSANQQNVYTAQNASSLQVSSDVIGSNVVGQQSAPNIFNWSVANVGASNQKLRLTIYANASDQTGFSYIVNSQSQMAWKNENGTWVSDNYNDANALWGAQWNQTLSQIKANWTGNGSISFTNSFGDNVTVTKVVINPTLPDSLFEGPT